MITESLNCYLAVSVALFAIGLLGVLIRRNTLIVFMCLELMLVASTLALVAFSRFNGTMDGSSLRHEASAALNTVEFVSCDAAEDIVGDLAYRF